MALNEATATMRAFAMTAWEAARCTRPGCGADLGGVDRSKTPWLVVVVHRQIYTDLAVPSDPVQAAMQLNLEPILIAHGVDVVLTAHLHTYKRTCAVKDRKCVAAGAAAPVYIVDGTAGAYTGGGNQGFSCVQPAPDPARESLAPVCGFALLGPVLLLAGGLQQALAVPRR